MTANQLEWRQEIIAYAAKTNEFVARGTAVGWDKAGPEPREPDLVHLITRYGWGLPMAALHRLKCWQSRPFS
jgi:hypothetical protein